MTYLTLVQKRNRNKRIRLTCLSKCKQLLRPCFKMCRSIGHEKAARMTADSCVRRWRMNRVQPIFFNQVLFVGITVIGILQKKHLCQIKHVMPSTFFFFFSISLLFAKLIHFLVSKPRSILYIGIESISCDWSVCWLCCH